MAGSVIGALRVSLSAETAAFDKGIDRSKTKLQQFDRDTKKASSGISGFGRDVASNFGPVGHVLDKMGSAGLLAGAGIGAAAAALSQIGGKMAEAARYAEELNSAVSFTFGKNADKIQAWAESTGDAMGRASTDLKQAALDFQTIFGPALGADAATEMSKQFAVLVQDLASFRNVSEDIVRQNLVSGLIGETEPLRKYGILINENTVKAKALEMGLVKAGQEVNDYGKIVARAQLILQATATAQGDVARTSDSATNKIRAANSATKEMAETIGSGLNPGLAAMAGLWTHVAHAIEWAAEAQQKFNRMAGAVIKGVAQGAGQAVARWDYEQARKRAALVGRVLPTYEEIQADSGRGPQGRGRNRAALGIAPAVNPASTIPSYVDTNGSGSQGKAAKPRWNGPLPNNVKDAISAGRVTEETIRAQYPDGVFPMEMALEQELMYATGLDPIEGYNPADFARGLFDTATTSQDRMNEATAGIVAATEASKEAFRDMFTSGLLSALRDGKDGVREWMRQGAERGLEQALNNLADVIFNLFSQMGSGSTGGFGSAIGSLFGSMFGGGSSIPGFATGGNFTVGGSGGTDSQLVQFRATPGEMVNITHGNDNGPMGMQVFDMRGAVVTQDLLNQVNEKVARGNAQVLGQVASASAMRDKAARYRVAR